MNERLSGCVWCVLYFGFGVLKPLFEYWTQFARVLVAELEILKATNCRLTKQRNYLHHQHRCVTPNWWRRTDHSHGHRDVIISQENLISWCTGACYCCWRWFVCCMYASCVRRYWEADAVRTIAETANREAATAERTSQDNSGWTPITTDEHQPSSAERWLTVSILVVCSLHFVLVFYAVFYFLSCLPS